MKLPSSTLSRRWDIQINRLIAVFPSLFLEGGVDQPTLMQVIVELILHLLRIRPHCLITAPQTSR
jgi:hypothetical protein